MPVATEKEPTKLPSQFNRLSMGKTSLQFYMIINQQGLASNTTQHRSKHDDHRRNKDS
jgi:hypothetical protein